MSASAGRRVRQRIRRIARWLSVEAAIAASILALASSAALLSAQALVRAGLPECVVEFFQSSQIRAMADESPAAWIGARLAGRRDGQIILFLDDVFLPESLMHACGIGIDAVSWP